MSKETNTPKQRTRQQEKAYHKGFTEIADLLVEHGISLQVALKNLDVRPTMNTIKDAYRSIAEAKYGVKSTRDLTTAQVSEVWDDLVKTLSQNTGIEIVFPSQEWKQLLQSYDTTN